MSVVSLYSVSGRLPRLNKNHKVFAVNKELSDQYVISVFTTLKASHSVNVNKSTGPDNIPPLISCSRPSINCSF